MNQDPLVTVVMAAYNAEAYIKHSIESILNQTYGNFELLIVDDGSTDRTSEIIDSFHSNRIRVIKNCKNEGLIYSLNLGVEEALGEFIARMDADDIAEPDRISCQVDVLKNADEIVLVGSWVELINDVGEPISKWEYPEDHLSILWNHLFNSAVAHPAAMFRKEAFELAGCYSFSYKYAEDFELWSRLSLLGKLYNVQRSLLKYRIHSGSVSQSKIDEQQRARVQISLNNQRKYLTESELSDSDYIDLWQPSGILAIRSVLNLRQRFISVELPSVGVIRHIDETIEGMIVRTIVKNRLGSNLNLFFFMLQSELALKTKLRAIVKGIIALVRSLYAA